MLLVHYSLYVESGEGIERPRAPMRAAMAAATWNPVKELKAISLDTRDGSLLILWNPVKELKVILGMRLKGRVAVLWNPVKELKAVTKYFDRYSI